MKTLILFFNLVLAGSIVCYAQENIRFADDVKTVVKYDKMYKPPVEPIVFVGSSSIRKWDDLERTFASYRAMNRGVGGTVINDITFYLNELVFAYKPRQIVIYVGDNDLPSKDVTADTVLSRTVNLYKKIREKLPKVPIVYISMKPSPSRQQYMAKAIASNQMIKDFLSKEKNAKFVDVFALMIDKAGKPRPELFVGDMLHMNAAGYQIWEKAVKPYLIP
jgi:lysophospholipase L1-like esterase